MSWAPLIDDLTDPPLARQARAAVREIAAAIATAPHPTARPADRAVFFAYAASVLDDPLAEDGLAAAAGALVDELVAGPPSPALFGGLAGAGWTLCHLVDDPGAALGTVDEALLRALRVERWRGAVDLTDGLAGIGVYLLERIAAAGSARAREGLAHVVRHLDAAAVHLGDGVAWTGPDMSGFDCGVAHGTPGIAGMLARAGAIADPPPRARALAREAVRWLARQRLAPDERAPGRFPTGVIAGRPAERARAAWCYGDPGIAAAIWPADPALALELARDAARRPAASAGVRDAGLCHGAAGLGHLHHRFFRATGERAFADAARRWLAHALELRRPGGIAGFTADGHGPHAGLLEGAIGTGLALVAALTPTEPSWDRQLLCDLPGGSR